MRKTFFSFLPSLLVCGAISNVAACTKPSYSPGLTGERIVLITDGAPVSDKSFNQISYETLLNYSSRDLDLNLLQGGFGFQSRHLSAKRNYVEPFKKDTDSFVSAYKVGVLKGADILVLSGFVHADTLKIASNLVGPNKTVVFIDSNLQGAANVITIPFASQLAGFAAGYDAAVWASQIIKDQNSKDGWRYQGAVYEGDDAHRLSFGTYAGISNKFGTDNYLWGFLVALDYFNKNVLQTMAQNQTLHNLALNPQQEPKEILLANIKGPLKNLKSVEGGSPLFYTNSFELGGATKSGINDLFKDAKADLIFPVAGPQILDTLTFNFPKAPNLIGVDLDQSLQYPIYANRFVTSALKNINQALIDSFDRAKANFLNHEKDGSLKTRPWFVTDSPTISTDDQFWDGKVAPSQINWSTDLDQRQNPRGSLIPKTLLDYENNLQLSSFIAQMKKHFEDSGSETKNYFNYQNISAMADWILANLPPLPLKFS